MQWRTHTLRRNVNTPHGEQRRNRQTGSIGSKDVRSTRSTSTRVRTDHVKTQKLQNIAIRIFEQRNTLENMQEMHETNTEEKGRERDRLSETRVAGEEEPQSKGNQRVKIGKVELHDKEPWQRQWTKELFSNAQPPRRDCFDNHGNTQLQSAWFMVGFSTRSRLEHSDFFGSFEDDHAHSQRTVRPSQCCIKQSDSFISLLM